MHSLIDRSSEQADPLLDLEIVQGSTIEHGSKCRCRRHRIGNMKLSLCRRTFRRDGQCINDLLTGQRRRLNVTSQKTMEHFFFLGLNFVVDRSVFSIDDGKRSGTIVDQ